MGEIVYNCLYGKVYEDFIKEAVRRSDKLSIQVYWPQNEFVFFNKEDYLKYGLSEESYNRIYKSNKHLFYKEKAIFETSTMSYLNKLEPFFLSNHAVSEKRLTYYIRSASELIPILLEPLSLDNWGYPNYPENLGFITGDEYWFYCTNHGTSNATLCPNDEADYEFWKEKIGIDFLEDFNPQMDVHNRAKVVDK